MAPPRFERCHVLQCGRWAAVPRVGCICDSFSPERIWNIGRSHHRAGLLEKFPVRTFCDTILFRRVGSSLLMIDSSALQVLLELAREIFTTTIRSKRLNFAPCALLQSLTSSRNFRNTSLLSRMKLTQTNLEQSSVNVTK